MTWLVQAMGIDVRNGDKVMACLKEKGIPYIPVGVRPFSTEITGLDGVELEQGKVMVYGSTKLVRLTKEMGLTPGAFFDLSTFNMMVWKQKFGCMGKTDFPRIGFFNDEAEFKQIRDLSGTLRHRRFVRPVLDLKAFDGQVVEAGDTWEAFFERTFKTETYDRNIMVAVGRTWPIYAEYRMFIVNRKVVTGSQYRARNGVLHVAPEVPDSVWRKAEEVATAWLPHDHCVLDLVESDGGVEIMEFNCINASGLYAADVEKFVDALNSLMV